jgi:hypothetical protein
MDTADWALVVSLLSFAVSLSGFVWNVWSKFIYPKPNVQVSFGIFEAWGDEGKTDTALRLSAVNHGPIEVTLKGNAIRIENGLFKYRHALLNPLDRWPAPAPTTSGPFSGGLPKKLALGEEFALYFVYPHETFIKEKVLDVGFYDSFSRNHWAPRKNVRKVRESLILKAD